MQGSCRYSVDQTLPSYKACAQSVSAKVGSKADAIEAPWWYHICAENTLRRVSNSKTCLLCTACAKLRQI